MNDVTAPPVRAEFKVRVDGRDLSSRLEPIVQRIRIRDESGAVADTCELELDDREGRILLPGKGALVEVQLRDLVGFGAVFRGTVDELRSTGGRAGTLLTVSAKGINTLSALKAGKERHWDDAKLSQVLSQAGEAAGMDCTVDAALGDITIPYVAQQGESFAAFGQRLAREVGGTFKLAGDKATLVKRNGGASASGKALPTIVARRGDNLMDWSIAPFVGRHRHRKAKVRSYDPDAAGWTEAEAETGDEEAEADHLDPFPAVDAADAGRRAGANAAEIQRRAGSGTVAIAPNAAARPEAVCRVEGARPGIDGDYRITAVEHALDRFGGLITSLELGQPAGSAGTDGRASPAT